MIEMTASLPEMEIEYCRQCRWLLRAGWMAQELLTTFEDELGGVKLVPGSGGVFEVRVDGNVLWSRKRRRPVSRAESDQAAAARPDRARPRSWPLRPEGRHRAGVTYAVMGLSRLKSWARRIKRDVVALWIAARDPRVPLIAKVAAGLVAAYALSPIDLIPDFIPIIGYLDDLIIVPLGILLAIRLTPAPLMDEFRQRAAQRQERPASYAAMTAFIVIWVATLAWLAWVLWPDRIARLWH
jgi:selT/selW/selH-like putative selenoprotein